jgi:general secretion pathway protein I
MMPTSKAGISRTEGFTLLEVIVALAIVSIALLGLLQLHLVSVQIADTAQTTTLAVLLAQEKMAETVARGVPVPGTQSGVEERDGSQFQWRTEVTNANTPQSCGLRGNALRQVCVDVQWLQGTRPRNVRMTTFIADTRIHE